MHQAFLFLYRHMKLFLLIWTGFFFITAGYSQDTKRYYFIELSTIYESGLVDKASDLILLKEKNEQDSLSIEKYCLALCRRNVASYNEVLDTLVKTFELYSVRFSKDSSGANAEQLLEVHSSFGRGYLIKMDRTRNMGPVIALLIKVYSPEVARVDYKVLHSFCPFYKDECAVEVNGVTLKHSR
jgi:DNA-directed RNA polymerase subunit N (RpoN/RPB10)